jgi:mono/diheme cytochrome c family protein
MDELISQPDEPRRDGGAPGGGPPGSSVAASFRAALTGLILATSFHAGCMGNSGPQDAPPPTTTFEKYYRSAEAGDAESQNLVGFMLFFGDMAPTDRALAQHWFRAASDQGHINAGLNLALISYLGIDGPRDPDEALRRLRVAQANSSDSAGTGAVAVPSSLPALVAQVCLPATPVDTLGEQVYTTFCAGCHGLNGIAAYVGSPSFALGERLEKNHRQLMSTVLTGHEVMPNWSDKLPDAYLSAALRFARSLELEFRGGVLHDLRVAPDQYFLFGPMMADSIAYRSDSALGLETPAGGGSSICPGTGEAQPQTVR